ncbi:MAG: 4Fe-4S dicluster domain-containing protein [Candidatus Omnitrophota bacterium]
MRYAKLKKDSLGDFITFLKNGYRVVGPVKKENLFVFADIKDASEMSLEYIPTILPLKKYFFPQHEELGSFNMGEVKMKETSVTMEPTVIFGAHTCDIDGLECLDAVFFDDPVDVYYKKRKKSIFVIGYECLFPCDEYATCVTMDTHIPRAGYDIMLTDAGDSYILHINSSEGDALLAGAEFIDELDAEKAKMELNKIRARKTGAFETRLKPGFRDFPGLFGKSYDSKVWEDVGKRCVSCGNCTAVCPTCYCFDIYDEVTLDVTEGKRMRTWDSCQLEEFASVAGGENFREQRSSRQRHRYYRKFLYPFEKHNKFFCTGCGRCSRACMADISLIETVNLLNEEKDNA